jgi:nitroimidazol reductase NimA-like FMN-containing flavoprotein (pyridoxamine 5'-phosphate oxidase superfamily)
MSIEAPRVDCQLMSAPDYVRANRQYVAMTPDEVWQFVDSQQQMYVALSGEDGYPHVTPVWHVSIDQVLYFRATSNKVKAKLADDAKVCCALADGQGFTELRGVVIRGHARVLGDPELIRRCSELIDVKYAGLRSRDLGVPDRWLAARDAESSSMIQVAPVRISSWDNSKLDAWEPTAAPSGSTTQR